MFKATTLNTYEIIDLTDEIIYKGIGKFRRYEVVAITPMEAVRSLFPAFIPKLDRHGMGDIVVKNIHHFERGDFESHYTFNLLPREVAV